MYRKKSTSGFSLTELLVAMALLVTVMGGVMVLYQGAMRTLRQGEITREATETARTTMDILQRDLETAFTSQEIGRQHQFYGGREGFMFVAQGETNRGSRDVGRITWFIRPQPSTETIQAEMSLTVEEVFLNIYNQIKRQAMEQGIFDDDAVLVMARDAMFTFDALYTGGTGVDIASLFADLRTFYDPAFPIAMMQLDNIFKQVVDIDTYYFAGVNERVQENLAVDMQTYALMRYSQRQYGDLDSLDLDPSPDQIAGPNMIWPPYYPSDYWVAPAELTESERRIHEWFTEATNPAQFNGTDIRDLIDADLTDPVLPPALNRINYDATSAIFNAAKREFWLRMLSGDPYYSDWRILDQSTRYWTNNANGIVPRDYVVAEKILRRAVLKDPGTGAPLYIDLLSPTIITTTPSVGQLLDILDVPPLFQYYDNDGTSLWYNSRYNIPGYGSWSAMGSSSLDDLVALDNIQLAAEGFSELYTRTGILVSYEPDDFGYTSWEASRAGSPLDPQMPTKVKIGFYIIHEKPAPGEANFRRWYEQIIDIPSGLKRSVPAELRAEAR